MKDHEFGELRAMTDVIAASPKEMNRVVGAMLDDVDLSDVVKKALGRIRSEAQKAPVQGADGKLVYAAEELLRGGNKLDEEAGLALYSALADYPERIDAREALNLRGPVKNPLINRFRSALLERNVARARR